MKTVNKFVLSLVRHGETFMNNQRLIQGHTDAVLSDVGQEQARKLGKFINKTEFTRAYSSDLKRAHNTAQLILAEVTTVAPEITTDKRLRERCYGAIEGKPAHEFVKEASKANVAVCDFVPEGAETIEELANRAASFFDELCKLSQDGTTDEQVLVVSHGGWIQGLLRYLNQRGDKYVLKNFEPKQAIRIHDNTAVTLMTITASSTGKFEINFLKVNDTAHLKV